MPRRVEDSVVVVTGASSGIGRAAALLLAGRGASVVLAARRADALESAAAECVARGGDAIAAPTDVAEPDDVEHLARAAVERFGRFDAWVNDASVACFARFEDTPLDVWRRIVDVNLLGTVHGCRAALAEFSKRGEGVIVNVASILGKATVPFLSAYNAAKFGVVGLSESLRTELEHPGIHVATVMPPATDTPFYLHAANYTGKVARPPRPVYDAETVAEAIVDAIEDPKPEVIVGAVAKAQAALHAGSKGLYELVAGKYDRELLTDAPLAATPGAVFEPMREGVTVAGGWKQADEADAPPPREAR